MLRIHQIESGLYNGCYLSFTRSIDKARIFATYGRKVDGFVYIVDEDLLAQYEVVAKEFSDSKFPDEEEVLLRAKDNGDLPKGIVVDKVDVSSDYF